MAKKVPFYSTVKPGIKQLQIPTEKLSGDITENKSSCYLFLQNDMTFNVTFNVTSGDVDLVSSIITFGTAISKCTGILQMNDSKKIYAVSVGIAS